MEKRTMLVSLNTVDKVKNFASAVRHFDCDMDLGSGRYIVDAKSIMGIFSLDISKPVELNVFAEDESQLDAVETAVAPFRT